MRKGDIHLWIQSKHNRLSYIFDVQNPSAAKAHLLLNNKIQESFGRKDPIQASIKPIEVEGLRYIDFLIPGLIALSLFSTSLYGIGMTLVVNRREKLLKFYKTTPMQEVAFFLSHLLGRYLVATCEVLIILLAGKLLFNFQYQGSWQTVFSLCFLGTSTFAAFSFLCGSRLENSGAYNGLANALLVPMMLLSGIWYSRSHFPNWLQTCTDYLPLTALADSLRSTMLDGASLSSSYFQCSILIVCFTACIIATSKIFRWY